MEAPDQKEVAIARREARGFSGGRWLKLHHIISQASHVYLLPPYPSPGDLPDPGIEPGSPALQADSLPMELSGKSHR